MAFGGVLKIAQKLIETDAVLVTRVSGIPGAFVTATVYSGNGSLQEGGGSMYTNPGGAVEQSDAILVVSNTIAASLPPMQIDDEVLRVATGKTYTVVGTSVRTALLPHVEAKLKVGPTPYEQK